jgi:hypothetical protein
MVVFGVKGEELLKLRTLKSIPAMGSIILGFSWSLATVQILTLQVLPKAHKYYHQGLYNNHQGLTSGSFPKNVILWWMLRDYGRYIMVQLPFTIMEILLVWVNCGRWVFVPEVVHAIHEGWWLWGLLLAASIISHYYCFLKPEGGRTHHCHLYGNDNDNNNDNDDECCIHTDSSLQSLLNHHGHGHDQSGGATADGKVIDYGTNRACNVTENSSIVGRHIPCVQDEEQEVFDEQEDLTILETSTLNHLSITVESKDEGDQKLLKEVDENKSFMTLVIEDARRMQLIFVFELLMVSITWAMLNQSIHVVKHLWPASKAILFKAHPHLHSMVILSTMVAVLMLMFAFI